MTPGRHRTLLRCALAAGLVLALAAPGAAAPAGTARSSLPPRAASLYEARGSWLDIFAGPVWAHPRSVVASLKRHGVTTLYLQTGNYSQGVDIVRPRVLDAWLRAAHAAGLSVVGWYLPSFAQPGADTRRAIAAIDYRSPAGDRFDGFALDIEASVAPLPVRSERLLALAAELRRAAPLGYPLGAIIPSPVGMVRHPRYWPHFPYRRLSTVFDAFLPMAYFSYYAHTPAAAYDYTRRVVTLIRQQTDPQVLIHLIGGLANRLDPAAVAAFARAAADCRVDGLSLYAFPQTSAAEWTALAEPAPPATADASCS